MPQYLPNEGAESVLTDSGAHGGHVEGDGTHVHAGEGPHLHSVRLPESMRRLRPGDRVLVAWIKDDAVVIDLFLPAVALGLPPRLAELLGGGQSGGDGTPAPRPEVPVELEAIARGQGYTTERLGGNRLQIDYGDGVVRVYDKYMVHMTDTGAFLVTIEWFREELISVAKEKAEGAGTLTTVSYIQTTVRKFFIEKGFSAAQTAGIMGNAMQESSWNPLCRGSGSSYWGLFQINKSLALDLERRYREAGLDMSLYGYDVNTYQTIGAETKVPEKDMEKILDIQLNYLHTCKPTSMDWITRLKQAETANEATEVFLVRFEGAISSKQIEDNKILYYSEYQGKYYQETKKRREYAAKYFDNH